MATRRVFFMSRKFEKLERQYFALYMGRLYPLGDCGDFEAALAVVRDQFGDESEAEWIADYHTVAQWCDVVLNVRESFYDKRNK